MLPATKTRRAWQGERAPDLLSLGGDCEGDTALHLDLQVAVVASRFGTGRELSRVIAEHAFARRPQR